MSDYVFVFLCVCVCVCVCAHTCACICAHVQVPMVFTLCEYTEILSTWFAVLRKTFDLLCFISSQNIQISRPFQCLISPWDSWASLHWSVFWGQVSLFWMNILDVDTLHLTPLLNNPSHLPIKHSCLFSDHAPVPSY